ASFHHLDWALDIRKDYISLLSPLGRGTALGLSLSALSMDEQPVTTVGEPDGNGLTYGVLDLALGISLARQVSDRLGYGLTMKTIHLSAYNETASGFAFDIGSILRTDFHDLRIGMALTNFGGDIKYEGRDLLAKADIDESIDGNYTSDVNLKTESWPLPLRIQIGIAVDVMGPGKAFFPSPISRLTLAIDAVHPNDSPEHLNAGLEWGWNNWLFLRGGYRFNYDEEQWAVGGGLIWSLGSAGQWSMNYSVVPLGVFGTTTQISLDWTLR
ncbi:MAG: PorV/PorQ family protein, partial [FCB group bacterium]|nr:PorV/PorQ family protein [FCB group bacterium]